MFGAGDECATQPSTDVVAGLVPAGARGVSASRSVPGKEALSRSTVGRRHKGGDYEAVGGEGDRPDTLTSMAGIT